MLALSIMLLRSSDQRFRGRVMGVRMLAIYTLPLGLLAAGPHRRGGGLSHAGAAVRGPGAVPAGRHRHGVARRPAVAHARRGQCRALNVAAPEQHTAFVAEQLVVRGVEPRILGQPGIALGQHDGGRQAVGGKGDLRQVLVARQQGRKLAYRLQGLGRVPALAFVDEPVGQHLEVGVTGRPDHQARCPHTAAHGQAARRARCGWCGGWPAGQGGAGCGKGMVRLRGGVSTQLGRSGVTPASRRRQGALQRSAASAAHVQQHVGAACQVGGAVCSRRVVADALAGARARRSSPWGRGAPASARRGPAPEVMGRVSWPAAGPPAMMRTRRGVERPPAAKRTSGRVARCVSAVRRPAWR
jgi:hypothetical protein